MKSICALVAVMAFGSVWAANTWYVDDDWYERGGDGSESAPFGTIRDAIVAAEERGTDSDTVLVAPGTYNKGIYGMYIVRVGEKSKFLTIRSTGGRDVTHIVGGENVGGVRNNLPNSCLIVDGFTIRGCRWSGSGDEIKPAYGSAMETLHLYNCTLTDNVVAYGVVSHATIHRSIIVRNRLVAPNNNYCATYYALTDNTLIIGNDMNGGRQTAYINTTVAGNTGYCGSSGWGDNHFYNSILTLGGNNSLLGDSSQKSYVSNCVLSASSLSSYHCAGNNLLSVPATNLFVNPIADDFRLRTGSVARGFGDPALLSAVILPSAERDPADDPGRYSTCRDFNGVPIDTSAAKIHAGAFQETVETAEPMACYSFKPNTAGYDSYRVDGRIVYGPTLMYFESAPTQFCLTAYAPETRPLSRVTDADWHRFPDLEGRLWMTGALPGEYREFTVICAQAVHYVDPVAGNDGYDGSSATVGEGDVGPWRTLQHAADSVTDSSYRIIRCARGTYAEGSSDESRLKITDGHRLHFIGAGAGLSVICGQSATNGAANGLGPGGLRCVMNESKGTGFAGFTFTGGRLTGDSEVDSACAAAIFTKERLSVTDSVISNNWGRWCATMGEIWMQRCFISENRTTSYTPFYSRNSAKRVIVSGCILRGNYRTSDNGIWNSYGPYLDIYHSTLLRGDAPTTCGVLGMGSYEKTDRVFNSVFYDFDTRMSAPIEGAGLGCVFEKTTKNLSGFSDPISGDVHLVDPTGGDCRVGADSPALSVPAWSSPEHLAYYLAYAGTDYEGNPVCRSGIPTRAGACGCADNSVDITDWADYLVIDGQPDRTVVAIGPGESVVVRVNPSSQRPVLGIACGAVTNLADAASAVTVTYEMAVAAGGLVARPVLGTTWYVNGGTDPDWGVGDDANTGWAKQSPKATIAAAMAAATAGDTIVVAPGRYVAPRPTRPYTALGSCVTVKADVSLVSERGAAVTTIAGLAATADEDVVRGCGSNAVRCVEMGTGSRLAGFTLADGHDFGLGSKGITRPYGAAAILADPGDVTVEDCVISNCVATYSLMYKNVKLKRCRFVCNDVQRCMTYSSDWSNVLAAKNTIREFGTLYSSGRNVTWANDNVNASGTRFTGSIFDTTASCVCNVLVFGAAISLNSSLQTNNVVVSGDYTGVTLDADYRPVREEGSRLVDMGENACYDTSALGDRDASGLPRVSNGRIDVGAFEADWRPVYAQEIGRGKIAVTEASPCVTNTAANTVSLGADGTLKLAWTIPQAVACDLAFKVTGTGTLTVSREGAADEVFRAKDEEQVYSFTPAAPGVEKLSLVYSPGAEDTGSAEIIAAKMQYGLLLIVR